MIVLPSSIHRNPSKRKFDTNLTSDKGDKCDDVSLDALDYLDEKSPPSLCSTAECSSMAAAENMEDSLVSFHFQSSSFVSYQIESDDDCNDELSAIGPLATSSLDLIRLKSINNALEKETALVAERSPRVRFSTEVEFREYEIDGCSDVYTNEDEEHDNRLLLRQRCRYLQRKNKSLVKRFNRAYDSDYSMKDEYVFDDWVSSDLRGLENYFGQEGLMHTKGYVEFVVTYYAGLVSLSGDASHEIDDDVDDMLRSRIVMESQLSRDFAYRLAIADHIEATK